MRQPVVTGYWFTVVLGEGPAARTGCSEGNKKGMTFARTTPASMAPPRVFVSLQSLYETLLTATPPAIQSQRYVKHSGSECSQRATEFLTGHLQANPSTCWGLSL